MRTAPKVICTVAATTVLFGLTSVAAANAGPSTTTSGVATTAPATTDADMSASKADSTRRFTNSNNTTHVLTVNDVWGTTGWPYPKKTGFDLADAYPKVGSVLYPGQQMILEIKDWSDHGITVKFKADNGRDVHVYMHVSGISRYSDAQGLDGEFLKGGGDVAILGKPGVITIPASDPAGQANTINTVCGQAAAKCTFTQTGEDPRMGTPHPFGQGYGNLTSSKTVHTVTVNDVVETSTSLEISAHVKATIMGAVETGLTTTYTKGLKTSHSFEQSVPLPVKPGEVGWRTAQEPVVRVTGDLTITLNGQEKWTLTGLVFDVPDANQPSGMAFGFTRPMTPEEVNEAWTTGGLVKAPWKNQLGGPAVQVAIPAQS
jgi:hypothetical protein